MILFHLLLCLKRGIKFCYLNHICATSLIFGRSTFPSYLLQSVDPVAGLLGSVQLQLCEFSHSVAKLLAQQRVLLSELLHSDSQLCQRAATRFTFFTQSLQGKKTCSRNEKTGIG